MKPLSAFTGMTGEMRELAVIVSKVRANLHVSCREMLVIFVIWECCLLLFTVTDSASYFSLHIAPQQVISLHLMMFLSDAQWEEIIKSISF